MPAYRRISALNIDADQFVDMDMPPRGVWTRPATTGEMLFFVTTIRQQDVRVYPGEWIVAEGDGKHFYPIADHKFRGMYVKDEQSN